MPGEVAAMRRQALPAPEALPEMVEAQAVVQGPRLRPPKPTGRLRIEEPRTSEPQQQEQLPRAPPPTSDLPRPTQPLVPPQSPKK